jgi:cupin fold WbuC family metalloprotein
MLIKEIEVAPELKEEPPRIHPFSIDQTQLITHNNVKIIHQNHIEMALIDAEKSPRARVPILIHQSFEEIPQRFVNCLKLGSYVRPHMHINPTQWELMCWISGELTALIFDATGKLQDKILMNSSEARVIEIPPFVYHSFFVLKEGAYLEIRNCKYQPALDRVHASWSPEEGSIESTDYLKRLIKADIGDMLISLNS